MSGSARTQVKSYDSLNLELYDAIGSTVDGLSFQVYRGAVLSQLLAMGLIPRDRKSTRLNSSHYSRSRMPSSA